MSAPIRLLVLGAALLGASAAFARQGEPPHSLQAPTKLARVLPVTELAAIDAPARRLELDAAARAQVGISAKRMVVADAREAALATQRDGLWEALPDGSMLWRAQVHVPGATDLRLAFDRYDLPPGARLHVIGADGYYQGPYTAADGDDEGRFEAPILPGERATIELQVPPQAWPLTREALHLDRVGAGFRDLFRREPIDPAKLGSPGSSGACNIDVVCPLGQPYTDESRAVAYYEFFDDVKNGWYRCTGTLLNSSGNERRSLFLTAAHCVNSAAEAASMTLYWNYRSSQCGLLSAPSGDWFNDNQRGATLRATRSDADISLVELTQAPLPEWHPWYAGWDARGATPSSTVGLHHPAGDVQKITTGPTPSLARNCIIANPQVRDTHWRTGPYLQGTTEGGSSGSALFTAADGGKRVIGSLSGGNAECSGSQPDLGGDCYGRLAAAWDGDSPATRLRDWLDPAGLRTPVLDGVDDSTAIAAPLRPHSSRALPSILRLRPPRP